MKTKRIAFGLLILALMACNFVTQLIAPPTATPFPTATFTPTSTSTPTDVPLAPAYIPPQCANKVLATLAPDTALAQPTLEAQTNLPISPITQIQIFNDMTKKVDQIY